MKRSPGYRLDTQLLAKNVREKRGNRSLRAVEAETGIAIAILSRIENAKLPPNYDNLGVICYWLGDNPATYFRIDERNTDDPFTVQLRAVQAMSAETANAFREIIRAAYAQVLDQASDDQKA